MPDKSLHNEKACLLQIAAGNQQDFAKLFDHYRPNLYTTALRMTGNAMIAEEILQDVFLKVWLKKEYLPDIDNFAGWLYTIAENLTYNALKRLQREKKRLQKLDQNPSQSFLVNPEHKLNEKEYEQLLYNAVRRLPDKQQQTYRLIKQEGMKREDAARILQVSPETVKWNLEQAMRSIRAFCVAYLEAIIIFLFFIPVY